MIKFENPEALWALLLLLPLVGVFLWFMFDRKKALKKMGDQRLIQLLVPEKPTYKHQIKFGLISLAYAFLVVALANPQIGRTYEKVQRQGVDLVVALDISRSMLAEDTKPNRLTRAKQFISQLIEDLGGDRIGLIIFAGNAYLQVPLTSDYVAAKSFLKTIDTELAPTQGTAIGEAIRMADESFEEGQIEHKAMLVISDGENHEGDALEAAKAAAENGMRIFTIGVGTPSGAPIPIYRNGRSTGNNKKDANGSIVFSKLNESMLQQVAAAGSGQYLRLNQGSGEVDVVMSELAAMEKQDYEEHVFTDYEDQFQRFLAIAILLIAIEFFISERKNRIFSDWAIFKTNEA